MACDPQMLECYTRVKMNDLNVVYQHRQSSKHNAEYRVVETPTVQVHSSGKFTKEMLYCLYMQIYIVKV